MAKPLVSLGIVTLFVGATGASVSGIAYEAGLFNSSISTLLEKENKFALLSSADSQAWNDSWDAYVNNNLGKERDEWNIKDWNTRSGVPEEFKAICKNQLSSKISSAEDPEYGSFTSYCTRPKTLGEALKKEGVRLLDTTGNKDEIKWMFIFEAYHQYMHYLPKTDKEVDSNSFVNLIEGCKALQDTKTTDIDYEESANLTKLFCSDKWLTNY